MEVGSTPCLPRCCSSRVRATCTTPRAASTSRDGSSASWATTSASSPRRCPTRRTPATSAGGRRSTRTWARSIGPVLIVGHSFGASTVLKMLSESPASGQISGLFLASTPWWEPEGWSAEYAVAEGFADRLPAVPIFLYHSIDDPEVPLSHLDIYRRAPARAPRREIPGNEHAFVTWPAGARRRHPERRDVALTPPRRSRSRIPVSSTVGGLADPSVARLKRRGAVTPLSEWVVSRIVTVR